MKLIIAEKPSLAKEIAFAVLNRPKKNKDGFWQENDIIVANLVGHILEYELPNEKWSLDNLPLEINLNKLKPKPGMTPLVKKIKTLIHSGKVDEIISAGDADQEGSLLVYEVLLYSGVFKKKNIKLSRMWILALDKKTIKKAFETRFDYNKDKPFILAGQSRTFADAYVGLNLTQLFSLKFSTGGVISVGRVQTPTLKLVRRRELEIENFVPKDYFNVKGFFERNITGDYFMIKDGKKVSQIFNLDLLSGIKESLTDKTFTVKDKKVTKKTKSPDNLPNLNDILKNIAKLYKIKAKKITADIQILYEKKLISYPRSESKFLPTSMAEDVKKILNDLSGDYKVRFDVNNKRIFDDSKVESHFAIIPLKKIENEEITDTQKKIYDYIRDKFIMAFMDNYVFEQTIIILENGKGAKFEIKGRKELEKGFKSYKSILNKDTEDVILPGMEKGDKLMLTDYKIKKDTTKPPKLLTEAELLAQMENIYSIYKKENGDRETKNKFSLGTPATRGGIIETLFKREYITNEKGYLKTTEKGRLFLSIIKDDIGIELTAKFENKLERIRNAGYSNITFKNEIKQYTDELVEKYKALEEPEEVKSRQEVKETGETCPLCGSPLVRRKGKYGEFTACSNYPNCKYVKKEPVKIEEGEIIDFGKGYKTVKDGEEYIIWKNFSGKTITKTEAKKLFSGKEVKLNNLKSKSGKTYSAAAKYNFKEKKVKLMFDKRANKNPE